MQNLLIIVGLMILFAVTGIFLMKNYSFRTRQKLFLTGVISLIVSMLIALILVLAYLDY